MGEKFKVDTDKLAGLGGGYQDVATYIGKVQALVDSDAGPKDGWEGLMSKLKDPFETTKTNTSTRYDKRQTTVYMTGNELITLANLYKQQEQTRGEKIRAAAAPLNPHDSYQEGDATTTAAHATTGELPDLAAPETEEADARAVIKDAVGFVADADEAIEYAVGWSPINDTFEKVIGNWKELTRIGNVYEKAGKGMEGAGKSLTTMTTQSASYWDGKAAQQFDEYAKNLGKGLEAEAPLTKVIKDCLEVLVEQIEKTVKSIAELVKKKLEESYAINSWKGTLKFLAKKIPVVGWCAEAYTVANILRQVWDEATKLVDQVQKAVDLVKTVIEFFKDPAGYLKEKGNDALNKALDGALDKAGIESDSGKQLAKDLPAAVLAAGDYGATPGDGLSVGAGSTPWDDGN